MDEKQQTAVPQGEPKRKNQWLALSIVLFVAAGVGALVLLAAQYTLLTFLESNNDAGAPIATKSIETPEFDTQTVLSGLSHPWDIAFLPDGQALFTERDGTVSVIRDGKPVHIAVIDDVYARGEGGLLGLAVDPKFNENRFVYTCFNSAKDPSDMAKGPLDVQVARWKVNADATKLEARQDIVAGMPSNMSGRHSGCRLAFGPDDYLWIGAGDAAQGNNPQDPKSLGGKILRVDRNGKAAPDNLGGNFDARIYSYGHRNTQGLAFAPKPIAGVIGYNVEHGSSVDDEVNPLVKGNFGWDPDTAYTEQNIPMTDKTKFRDAVEATWKSGDPTQAPSGANFVTGRQWKAWDGALAIAMLKAEHLKILTFTTDGKIDKEARTLADHGRLRAVRQAPDKSLYVTTDNGDNDQILRLVPKQ